MRAIWIGEGVAYTDALSESTVGYTFKAPQYNHFPRGQLTADLPTSVVSKHNIRTIRASRLSWTNYNYFFYNFLSKRSDCLFSDYVEDDLTWTENLISLNQNYFFFSILSLNGLLFYKIWSHKVQLRIWSWKIFGNSL